MRRIGMWQIVSMLRIGNESGSVHHLDARLKLYIFGQLCSLFKHLVASTAFISWYLNETTNIFRWQCAFELQMSCEFVVATKRITAWLENVGNWFLVTFGPSKAQKKSSLVLKSFLKVKGLFGPIILLLHKDAIQSRSVSLRTGTVGVEFILWRWLHNVSHFDPLKSEGNLFLFASLCTPEAVTPATTLRWYVLARPKPLLL